MNNKLAIWALVIALFGGIPGAIGIKNSLFNEPKFIYNLDDTIIGTGKNDDNSNSGFIILFGSITNSGNKTLIPRDYVLEVNSNGKWVPFQHALVYKYIVDIKTNCRINLDPARQHDLQRSTETILPGAIVYGTLQFTFDPAKFKSFNTQNVKFKLTCIDVFGKKYTSEFITDLSSNISPGILPKYGVIFPNMTSIPPQKVQSIGH